MKHPEFRNREYFVRKRGITCRILRKSDGFTVEAIVDKTVSRSDRSRLETWFKQYRDEILRTSPLYTARLCSQERGYSLVVRSLKIM